MIDSRGRHPLDLAPLRTETRTLAAGGVERHRFEDQVQRLLAYETRAVVMEATWQLELGQWRPLLQGTVEPCQNRVTRAG